MVVQAAENKRLIIKEPNEDAIDIVVEAAKHEKLFPMMYFSLATLYIPIWSTLIFLMNQHCPRLAFPLVWLLLNFMLLCISVHRAFKYPRTEYGIRLIRWYDVLTVLWGILGIIGYSLSAFGDMKGWCAIFMWNAVFACSIASVVIISIVFVIVYASNRNVRIPATNV